MKIDNKTRLEHMLESAQDTVSFLGNMSEDDLATNKMVLNAIVRSVEIIGEAASQITQQYRDNHLNIPWVQIIGMRNRLTHAYFDIDYEIVYNTVHKDLPSLIDQVKKLLFEYK